MWYYYCMTNIFELKHYFGTIVRNADGTWRILNDAGHASHGLIDVTIDSMKRLVVTFPAFTKVGVGNISMDETWGGKYSAGGSVGFDCVKIVTRATGTGTQVYPANLVGSGNIWVDLWGWVEVEAPETGA